ncbi:MAG TPA: hypothetical protein VD997_08220 [Phycisphaerales bacterium]|nr:hypothetical protein [Phycisphaerales bacterium]
MSEVIYFDEGRKWSGPSGLIERLARYYLKHAPLDARLRERLTDHEREVRSSVGSWLFNRLPTDELLVLSSLVARFGEDIQSGVERYDDPVIAALRVRDLGELKAVIDEVIALRPKGPAA